MILGFKKLHLYKHINYLLWQRKQLRKASRRKYLY